MANGAGDEARARLDALAKPAGSLGLLEDWAVRLASLQHAEWRGRVPTATVRSPALLVFAADHGSLLAHPELSAFPRLVTHTIFKAIAAGGAASATLAAANSASLELVDVGVDAETALIASLATHVSVVVRKVAAHGTADSGAGPAMSIAHCDAARAEGAAAVRRALARGANVVCVGELGLGNTTAAAALLASLGGVSEDAATGNGTGLDEPARVAKARFVARALEANAAVIAAEGAAGALRSLGGLELAAIVGAIHEASASGIAVLVDGFIAGAAALAAVRIAPASAAVVFLSHRSAERGAARLATLLHEAGCSAAALDLGMRLGEGTGALVALGLLRNAAAIYGMSTLAEAMAL